MNYKKETIRKHCKSSLRILGLLLVIVAFAQCGEETSSPTPEPMIVDLAQLRLDFAQHTVEHLIQGSYQQLSTETVALVRATQAFQNDLTVDNLSNLQSSLKNAWIAWQPASIFQFGPAEQHGVRGALNIYPVDVEKIENNISTQEWTLGTVANQDAIGFPALDYLLHAADLTETIAMFENDPYRVDYLQSIVSHIAQKVETAHDEWQSGDFITHFQSGSASGTDVGSALGIIINTVDLHLQRYLRDGKVGIPAGVRSAGVPRPKATEARYAGYSGDLLVGAIQAYKDLMNGTSMNRSSDGASIIDYLEAIDQRSLAKDLNETIDNALTQAITLDNNFANQIAIDNQAMIDTFIDLQSLVTLVKSDMSSVMGIMITNQDIDGD